MNAIKSILRYPSVIIVLTVMAVAVGIHALMTMPRTEDPDRHHPNGHRDRPVSRRDLRAGREAGHKNA